MSAIRYCTAFAAALVVGCFFQGCSSSPTLVRAASVKPEDKRHEAPDFALKDADGKTVHLTDYRGKVVLLDFWATWCPPCKLEIPWLIDIERKNKDRGFAVLGVSMDDEGWEVVKPFMKEVRDELSRGDRQRCHGRDVRRRGIAAGNVPDRPGR